MIDGAYAMIHAAMPPTPVSVLRRAYRDGVHFQSSRGVTASKCVHVCEQRLQALKELDDSGELTVRIEAAISWQDDIFPVRRRWELLSGERHYYRSARPECQRGEVPLRRHRGAEVLVPADPLARRVELARQAQPDPRAHHRHGGGHGQPRHPRHRPLHRRRRARVFLDAVAEARRRNGFSGAPPVPTAPCCTRATCRASRNSM